MSSEVNRMGYDPASKTIPNLNFPSKNLLSVPSKWQIRGNEPTLTPKVPSRPAASPRESVLDDESEEYIQPTSKATNPWQVSLRLVNSGSVARDHLASERTYLAYARTSLGIASAGVALTQFFKVSESTRRFAAPLGATAIGSALVVLFIGTYRYFHVQATLPTGHYPASRIGTSVIALIIVSLIIATFTVVIQQYLEGTPNRR